MHFHTQICALGTNIAGHRKDGGYLNVSGR